MSKITKYSIKDLHKDFPTDEACLKLLFNTLHSEKCSCGGTYSPLFHTIDGQLEGRKQYQCSKCRYQIAPTSNTIFHKSDTPLTLWFHAIWAFSNAKSGISAKEMERQLGVTYKCAWRILSLIRKALEDNGNDKLDGSVEIDTGYFGGRHYAGKNNEKLSEAIAKKSVVIIAIQRGGKMKAEIVPDGGNRVMTDFILRNIKKSANLITDSSRVYMRTDKVYSRFSVDHHKGEYVRGAVHINTVETFFSHLKRSMKGTHKVISKKYLQDYLNAFVFHYNNRHNDRQRFGTLLGTLLHA